MRSPLEILVEAYQEEHDQQARIILGKGIARLLELKEEREWYVVRNA